MNKNGLYVVQRLSDYYQLQRNEAGKRVERFSCSDKRLVGFKLLTHLTNHDCQFMNKLSDQLTDTSIDNFLLEIEQELCLFVKEYDSSLVLRLLKNMGAAIADEPVDC